MAVLRARALLPAALLLALLDAGAAQARPKPDLSLKAARVVPTTVAPGARVTFRARLMARGETRAPRSTVGWYLRSGRGRTRLGRTAAKPLRESRTVTKSLTLPARMAAANYRLVVCADDTKRIRERDEHHNCTAGPVVRVRAPTTAPPPVPPPAPDTTAPAVVIDLPADGATTGDQTPTFTGTSSDPGTVRVEISAEGSQVQALSANVGTDGHWSATASILPVGRYTAVATQSDAAGNQARAQRDFLSPAVLLAAGDIASCSQTGDTQTASLLAATPADRVAALGDNAYEDGSSTDFDNCYDPTWGFVKAKTSPAAGNHEYQGDPVAASGYFGYFGAAAGTAGQGWYSYDLGDWHVIVLNSSDQCNPVACAIGPQRTFLQSDLAAHTNRCTLAYWHHPLFTSDSNAFAGATLQVKPFWDDLYAAGADLVLNGHSHIYERFGPQSATGVADANGPRQFIVGTGGYTEHTVSSPVANSEALNNDTFGVLRLVLRPADYSWQFLPVAGKTFTDAGSASCH